MHKTTALGRTTSYGVDKLWSGRLQDNMFLSGLSASATQQPSGVTTTTLPDGTVITAPRTPDPRLGMMSPLQSTAAGLPPGFTMPDAERQLPRGHTSVRCRDAHQEHAHPG